MKSTLLIQHAVKIATSQHRRFLAALVIAIATSGNAQTEPPVATVTGTVIDASGARVPGAGIQLAHPGAPFIQTKTDGKGEFEITAGPGEYVLQTVAPGFITDKLPVHLSATTPTATHIVLQIENWGCGVCISTEPATIKTLDASLSATLPLTPMPLFKQTSRKPHSPGK
jgi:hypothetical protein